MTIRQTAYETTACSGFVTTKITNALEEVLVSDGIPYAKGRNVHVINRNLSTIPVPPFLHPITVKDGDRKISVVDVRSTGKFDDVDYEFKIRNQYEYDFISLYGELTDFWTHESVRLLSSVSNLPMSLFSRWLSENITRRFGLNPQDQLTISILAAFFYASQFTDEEKVDIRELHRIVGMITKATFTNAEAVLAIIDERDYIKNIEEFCNLVKEITGNVRLNDLNVGVLYSILGSSWYGSNAKELVAVALEYPPAWILITYSSYVDRSFKNTGIAKMSMRDKKADIDSFIKSLVTLIRGA